MIVRRDEIYYRGKKPNLVGEKFDVYSLGLSLLLDHLSITDNQYISDLKRFYNETWLVVDEYLKRISDPLIFDLLQGMLE